MLGRIDRKGSMAFNKYLAWSAKRVLKSRNLLPSATYSVLTFERGIPTRVGKQTFALMIKAKRDEHDGEPNRQRS